MGTKLSKFGTFFAIRTRIGVQFSPRVTEETDEWETEDVVESDAEEDGYDEEDEDEDYEDDYEED